MNSASYSSAQRPALGQFPAFISRRLCAVALITVTLITGVGCGGGGGALRVVSETPSNPLSAKSQFVLMQATRVGLIVDGVPEEAFIAGKQTEAERVAFRIALDNMSRSIGIGLQTEMTRLGIGNLGKNARQPGAFLINVNLQRIEPGFNYWVAGKKASTQSGVRITATEGPVVSELLFTVDTGSSMTERVGERLDRIGTTTGKRIARYIAKRMGVRAK